MLKATSIIIAFALPRDGNRWLLQRGCCHFNGSSGVAMIVFWSKKSKQVVSGSIDANTHFLKMTKYSLCACQKGE